MRFLILPFHSKKNIFYLHAEWLALSCTEVFFFAGKKDRRMGLDQDRELWQPQLRARGIAYVITHHVLHP